MPDASRHVLPSCTKTEALKCPPIWRISPVSKWLVSPIYKPLNPFGRGTTIWIKQEWLRGELNASNQLILNRVANVRGLAALQGAWPLDFVWFRKPTVPWSLGTSFFVIILVKVWTFTFWILVVVGIWEILQNIADHINRHLKLDLYWSDGKVIRACSLTLPKAAGETWVKLRQVWVPGMLSNLKSWNLQFLQQ